MMLAIFATTLLSPQIAAADVLQDARALEWALDELKSVALDEADESAESGSSSAEIRRDNVADEAVVLALSVHRRVIRSLKEGHSLSYVRDRFEALAPRLYDLRDAVDEPGISYSIERAMDDVEDAWQELDDALRPLNVTASCVGKFGGNFLNKKTHVECTVTGRGVSSYYARFENEIDGNTITADAQGALNTEQTQQSFVSQKVSVGRYANYTVYLVDRYGNYHLVAQGQATGNPF